MIHMKRQVLIFYEAVTIFEMSAANFGGTLWIPHVLFSYLGLK